MRRGIAAYLAIAFLGAWALWLSAWLVASRLFHVFHPNVLAQQLIVLPGAFMPSIAAIVVRKWITREGFSDAGLRLSFAKDWKYYVLGGYVLPLLVLGWIIGAALLLGISRPDFSLHRWLASLGLRPDPSRLRITPALWPVLLLETMVVGVPFATLLTWGEEFGWRSYLQIRLLAERPMAAAVATGIIWGAWHYPLIIFLGYDGYENIPLGLLVFTVCTILLSLIFGWLRLRTGSIWATSVAHGATNSLGVSVTLLLFGGGPHFLLVSYLGILSWIPLGAVCLWMCLHWPAGSAHLR
jgi:uncharacterized protein